MCGGSSSWCKSWPGPRAHPPGLDLPRPDVVRALAAGLGPGASARDSERLAEAFLGSERRVAVGAERGLRRYTTPELLDLERELVALP